MTLTRRQDRAFSLRALWVCIVATSAACGLGSAEAQETSIGAFVQAARESDIVIIGEIHDNPFHHRNQAEIVARLQPKALVFEMIPRDREGRINELRAAGAGVNALAEALDWADSGWPDFAMYAPILQAAPAARVFGAGLPPAHVRRAAKDGAAAAFGSDAALYGLDLPLPAGEQRDREKDMAASHCDMLPEAMLPGMVEAQRLRDAGLAQAAIRAHATTDGDGPVAVIAGTGHADAIWGAPALIATAAPELELLALGQFEDPPLDPDRTDAYLLAPAPEPGDPCDGLSTGDG